MPSKEKITEEMYLRCKRMLYKLLSNVYFLGFGYTIQLVYELSVIVISYENGFDYVSDSCFKEKVAFGFQLLLARNTLSHNIYNKERITKVILPLYTNRVIYNLYMQAFGKAPGYDQLEINYKVYMQVLERLWK